MKILRSIIFLLIVAVSIYCGFYLTGAINELLAFQVSIYGYILEGQEALGTVTGAANDLRNNAQEFFNGTVSESSAKPAIDTEARLASYAAKIHRFAVIMGIFGSVLSYVFLSNIVFGIRAQYKKITTFINE